MRPILQLVIKKQGVLLSGHLSNICDSTLFKPLVFSQAVIVVDLYVYWAYTNPSLHPFTMSWMPAYAGDYQIYLEPGSNVQINSGK